MSGRRLAALVLVGALAACGSRVDGGDGAAAAGSSGTAYLGRAEPSRAASVHPPGGPAAGFGALVRAGATSVPPPSPSRPGGAPAEPLRLGVIAVRPQEVEFVTVTLVLPDMKPIIRAVVDELNDHGGIGGRRVEVVVHEVDLSPDPAAAARTHEAACIRLTEDERVFLVVSLDNNAITAAGCYARHRTPYIDFTSADETLLRELQPWLLPSPVPHLDTIASMLVASLSNNGYFDAPVGVWIYDTPEFRRSAERSLLPAIAAVGGDVVTTFTGLIGDGASAMLRFRAAGVERVVIWDGGVAWIELANAASTQRFVPRWGVHSMLGPQTWLDGIPAEQRAGAAGAGWLVAADVPQSSFDLTARERWCFDAVNDRAGTRITTRSSSQGTFTLMTCELLEIVRAAIERAPDAAPRAEDVWSLVASLGEEPPVVTPPQTWFEPTRLDGGRRHADLAYDTTCACFAYASAWRLVE